MCCSCNRGNRREDLEEQSFEEEFSLQGNYPPPLLLVLFLLLLSLLLLFFFPLLPFSNRMLSFFSSTLPKAIQGKKSKDFALYDRCSRMLPPGVNPQMRSEEVVASSPFRKKTGTKRKTALGTKQRRRRENEGEEGDLGEMGEAEGNRNEVDFDDSLLDDEDLIPLLPPSRKPINSIQKSGKPSAKKGTSRFKALYEGAEEEEEQEENFDDDFEETPEEKERRLRRKRNDVSKKSREEEGEEDPLKEILYGGRRKIPSSTFQPASTLRRKARDSNKSTKHEKEQEEDTRKEEEEEEEEDKEEEERRLPSKTSVGVRKRQKTATVQVIASPSPPSSSSSPRDIELKRRLLSPSSVSPVSVMNPTSGATSPLKASNPFSAKFERFRMRPTDSSDSTFPPLPSSTLTSRVYSLASSSLTAVSASCGLSSFPTSSTSYRLGVRRNEEDSKEDEENQGGYAWEALVTEEMEGRRRQYDSLPFYSHFSSLTTTNSTPTSQNKEKMKTSLFLHMKMTTTSKSLLQALHLPLSLLLEKEKQRVLPLFLLFQNQKTYFPLLIPSSYMTWNQF
jgi:hypothetical protein